MAPVGLAITWNARGASGPVSMLLLAHHHRHRFAFEVCVWLATDVDGYPLDGAAAEAPRHHTRVVISDTGARVAADAQAFAADHELARLCLDRRLADLLVTVEQRQGAVGDARWVLARFLERRREDQVLASRDVLVADNLLLETAHEVVDIVEAAVFDVERMPAESRTVGEDHPCCVRAGEVDERADRV